MGTRILSAVFAVLLSLPALADKSSASYTPAIPLLRLKMALDQINYDDIAIGFLASASTTYNSQIDSHYLPGIDAGEGFASLSSDNVPLSVNIVPLPGQAPLVIRLDVEAKNSGSFTMLRTQLDSIPQVYDIWLMDKYAKDSLNLRTDTSYVFNINKNDTASYGSNRFSVVIRQSPARSAHFVSFDVAKSASGNKLTWATENEQSTTVFWAERSIDNGQTFVPLDSVRSDGTGAYSYTDKTPLHGANLYRVKMTDANGAVTFSNSMAVGDDDQPAKPDNVLSIYPNPSNGPINLTITTANIPESTPAAQAISINKKVTAAAAATASFTIKIVNINGHVIRTAKASSFAWQDNLSALMPGTYVVQVINNTDNRLVGKSAFIKL